MMGDGQANKVRLGDKQSTREHNNVNVQVNEFRQLKKRRRNRPVQHVAAKIPAFAGRDMLCELKRPQSIQHDNAQQIEICQL